MLNNRGQALVLFVIVLPILILMLILVIDVGKIIVLKNELTNISNIVLEYGIDNMYKDNITIELEELVELNKKDIDEVKVNIENDKIYLYLSDKSDGVFASFIDISIFNVKTSYVGYIDNQEKRIEKMGD